MDLKKTRVQDVYPYNLIYDLVSGKGTYLNKYKKLDPTVINDTVINTDMSLVNKSMDDSLTYRDRYILSLRYVDRKTYREIGEIHSITPCRVQQIIDRSLIRIRIRMAKLKKNEE